MTTPAAPSALALDLLVRGVSFNPRYVRPSRLPRWPLILGRPAEGVVIRFEDGVTVIPPVAGRESDRALRLRDVRGETIVRDGDAVAGSVTLVRMPPGFGESAPSRIPFSAFLAPLPGILVADLGGASFSGQDRCAFCAPADASPSPRVVDLAEGFARFGRDRSLHLSICCSHRFDDRPILSALETAAAILPCPPVSIEVPPGAGREGLRLLAARGVCQVIVDLDVLDEEALAARCPGKGAAIGWERLRGQVEDGLAVFGKGRVGVRMILYPEDVGPALPMLKRLAASGAVPVIIPVTPPGSRPHDPEALRALARRVASAGHGRALPIDPYAGHALPAGTAMAPAPWYRRFLSLLGIGGGGKG